MRSLHTGEALGFLGQTVAGLASLGGCFLVWTGFAMAWQRFRYRKREADGTPVEESMTTRAEINTAVVESTPQMNERSMEVSTLEMKQTNSTATNGYAHNGYEDARTDWTAAPYTGDSI